MKVFILLTLSIWCSSSFAALTTKLVVDRVENAADNQIAANTDRYTNCDVFRGTFHGNTITLKPWATGGSGRYSHRLVWNLSESYETFEGQRTQDSITLNEGRTYRFQIPKLKSDVSFVQQTVFLITKDLKSLETVTSQLVFNVSRPVILSQTINPEKLKNNCYQVMPSMESVAGILSNGSTNPSQILIRHGIQNLWTRTKGSQWGFYISPLAWTVLANVFSFNKSYFTQYSRQTTETVEISNEYEIAPGDFIQLFEQRTRYISAFDAYEVDACGDSREIEGTYFLQWWGVTYHAIPVNPYSTETIPRETIGVAPMNTCPDELTPEFIRDNQDYVFAGAN